MVQQREDMADAVILDARAVWFNLGKALKKFPCQFHVCRCERSEQA